MSGNRGRKMKTVLCIDDDSTGLSLRKMMLEAEAYYVFTANNGEEGLALLNAQRIDAVILDYRMPEMNGDEVARRIRDRLVQYPGFDAVWVSRRRARRSRSPGGCLCH